jgi:maltose O-acetyltransferase
MTEREKCMAGEMYDTSFPGREAENLACLDLCFQFNHTKPSELAVREELIRRILHKVGRNVRFEQNVYISFGYNIEAGDNLFVNHNCVFLDPGKITFGDNVYIGPQCGFYTAHHNIHPYWRNQGFEYAYPITIGNDVWIGGGCLFMPGVTVGNNVVIGGGSVVCCDIPDNVVAYGNPCKVRRAITDQDKRDRT